MPYPGSRFQRAFKKFFKIILVVISHSICNKIDHKEIFLHTGLWGDKFRICGQKNSQIGLQVPKISIICICTYLSSNLPNVPALDKDWAERGSSWWLLLLKSFGTVDDLQHSLEGHAKLCFLIFYLTKSFILGTLKVLNL